MAASGGREETDATVLRSSDLAPTGYPLAIFPSGFDLKFQCTFCKLILRQPLQGFCGHRFCADCAQFLQSRSQETGTDEDCPGCVEENLTEDEDIKLKPNQMFPDNAVKREMSKVSVVCCYIGCDWAGQFKQYYKHHSDCKYQEVTCDCGQSIQKLRLEEHKEKECPCRTVDCKHCGQKFVFIHKEEHDKICSKFPLKCNSCGKKRIPRDKMDEHMRIECPTPRLLCPLGCQEMVERSKLEQHLKTNLSSHLISTKEKIDSVEQMIEQRLSSSAGAESLDFLRTTVEGLVQKLEHTAGSRGASIQEAEGGSSSNVNSWEIVDRMKTYEDIMKVMCLENRRLTSTIETLEQQIKTDKQTQERQEEKIRTLERILALKDVSLAEIELRLSSIELVSYDSILLWKITDFARKRQEAITGKITSLYSPAFYTSKRGYKMCARLYPNGDGMGKGSHLSLFFVLMRGHCDALLPFPFKERVSLMLLDQSGKEKPEHVVDAFRPDPSSSSFKKPTSEMNIASGCPLFVSLKSLQSVSAKYVVEDTIFIKIIVDCKDN